MGIFRFSYAVPLSKTATVPGDVRWPEEREGFQFSIGSAF
jgi:outer membrane protein assembly factor BamA